MENAPKIHDLQRDLNILLDQEDLKWRQRAKLNWYRLGDRNTKFFSNCDSQRRRRNKIMAVNNVNSIDITRQLHIQQAFVEHFQGVFTSSNPSSVDINRGLYNLKACVSSEHNVLLDSIFTRIEVEQALKMMDPYKSLGPDGFGPCFFQENWTVVGERISGAMLDFLNGGVFMEEIIRPI